MSLPSLRAHFGPDLGLRLGGGGEADVYPLGEAQVVRLCRPGASLPGFAARNRLMAALGGSCGGVVVPKVLDQGMLGDQPFTIETRIAGQPLSDVLGDAPDREGVIRAYMEAARQLGQDPVREAYGEIGREDAIRSDSLQDFMTRRVAQSMADGGVALDARALSAPFENPQRAGIVHLDYFAGNVMSDGRQITGVLDFGYSTIIGDPDFTPVLAAIYLTGRITPPAIAQDRTVALDWLAQRDLGHLVVPLRRWIAAYWSFCRDDDPQLNSEIRKVLGV